MVYEIMKAHRFRASDYLIVVAYLVAAKTDEKRYVQAVEKAKAFYDGMKANHRFITGRNDYIYAAMLGISDVELESGLKKMEHLYRALKPRFFSGNGVQALTQVLVLGGEDDNIETRVFDLSERLRQRGLRFDKEYTLPALGILALLPIDTGTLVDEVNAVYQFLRTHKGFGGWAVTKQELLLISSAIAALDFLDNEQSNQGALLTTELSTSITNIITAQQATIAAAAVATSSASASASAASRSSR